MADELVGTEQQVEQGAELGLTEQAVSTGQQDSGNTQGQVFDLDGEQVTIDQVKQWKQGNLMQSDYTRKAQELAQQRDQLKPYVEMADYLKANPTQAQQVYNFLSGQQPLGAEVDPREIKIQQLERAVQGIVVENSRKEALSRIDRIKLEPKYEGLFKDPQMEELLLAKAMQTNDYNLNDTAETLHKLVLGLKATTKMETEKTVQKNLNSPTRKGQSTAGGIVDVPKGFDPAKADKREIRSRALDMLS